jgi:hypothetical protein
MTVVRSTNSNALRRFAMKRSKTINKKLNNISTRLGSTASNTVRKSRKTTQRRGVYNVFPPPAPNNTRLAKDIKIAKMIEHFNILYKEIGFKKIVIEGKKYDASVLLSKLAHKKELPKGGEKAIKDYIEKQLPIITITRAFTPKVLIKLKDYKPVYTAFKEIYDELQLGESAVSGKAKKKTKKIKRKK